MPREDGQAYPLKTELVRRAMVAADTDLFPVVHLVHQSAGRDAAHGHTGAVGDVAHANDDFRVVIDLVQEGGEDCPALSAGFLRRNSQDGVVQGVVQ